ncbi:MAG TPA: LysR family transcriptional regulator [Azospirillaceae bacterium]|nr:LysR family transcriptional regulator [Azospirillaceae bacterium]
MDWDDLRYFLAVVRTGNLVDSAKLLKASPSTVSRRLALLERSLGVTLFVRDPSGHRLTDEGRALVTRTEPAEDILNRAAAEIGGLANAEFGEVRLATAEGFTNLLILPNLPAFHHDHPGIRLQITTSVHTIGLSRREADIALRLTRPEKGNLTVRKVGLLGHAFYAAPAYLARRPFDPDRGGSADHTFIGWDEEFSHLPIVRWLYERMKGARPVIDLGSLAQHATAARAGLGVALLPCFVGDSEPGLARATDPIKDMVLGTVSA